MFKGLLSWMPPSVAEYTYTVLLKPKPLRALAQAVVRRMIPKHLHVHGIDLVLNQQDAIVSGALTLGCYERHELTLFESLLKPGMCVLDVGANIGLYAAVAARAVGPRGRVIAVEPDARNCELIRQTVARNGFGHVEVVQKAVTNFTGTAQLYLCADNMADHRIYGNQKRREAVPVEVTRLDDLMATLGGPVIDVMKMDIQGAEALAFAGMKQTLRANPNIQVLIEFWPWGILQSGRDPSHLLREIRELGFWIHEIDADRGRIDVVVDDSSLARQDLERQHVNLLLQRRQFVRVAA